MADVLHLLPHPGGGGERQHRLLAGRLPQYRHEFAALAGHQDPRLALPGLLFRRPFLASRARRASVIHVDGDTASILSAALIGHRPFVITTAGLHLLRRSRGRLGRAVRRRLRDRVLMSRATMCTSSAELEELRDLCGDEAPLMLVRNGVPLPRLASARERAAARAQFQIGHDEVAAVMLARLEPRKQPLLAARAASRARAGGIPLVLLAAGEGPLKRRLTGLGGDAVRALGFVDDTDCLLAAADLFVLVSEREGMSLGLLEAMAAGLPAIVTDGPGNPEAVAPDCGIVIPTADEDALVDALAALASDPMRRQAAGIAARRRVEAEFSIEQMVAGVAEAYRRCFR